MWAAWNVRIARYLTCAVFALCILYVISPRYEGSPVIASSSWSSGEAHTFNWKSDSITTSSQDAGQSGDADNDQNAAKKPNSAVGNGVSEVPAIGDTTEFPLGVTPSEPGWMTDMNAPAPGPRMNATFVTLARNSDVWSIAGSIQQVEDRFNRRFHYDWVFLNDQPFDETFIRVTTKLCSGKTHYGLIPKEHWSYPDWIDQDRAAKVREDMKSRNIIYGGSESYRHMCRFEAGFFFRHELMLNYEYYWRVEPSIKLFCDIHYDPFRLMAEQKKKYSFVLSLYEYVDTIPTLWGSTKEFMREYSEHIAENNLLNFLSDDGGTTYNLCHFWSNFEIASLDWLRSKPYLDFFNFLDKEGGFFYERWGDAPVHSIAAGLLLSKDEVYFFNDIAYYHGPFTHCPTGLETRMERNCHCDPNENFDWKGYSCTARYFDQNDMKKPDGYEQEQ